MTDEAENKTEYEVIGIRFKDGGKIYYFDPCGITAKPGENLIVETARGLEYGGVAVSNKVVPESEIVLPLRPVIRHATADDDAMLAAAMAAHKIADIIFFFIFFLFLFQYRIA